MAKRDDGKFIVVKRTTDDVDYYGADTRKRASEDAVALIEDDESGEDVVVEIYERVSTVRKETSIVEDEE